MATTFYGINKGETTVTINTSTTGKDVEVAVLDTNAPAKLDIAVALELIKNTIEHG